MPSVSQAQHNLMAMASTPAGRRKLRLSGHRVPAKAVAKEFVKADTGRKLRLKRKGS